MHEANCSHAHPSYPILRRRRRGGRSRHPLSGYIYARHGTTERHGRDNRPCPFLKAELKSFSTGVQRSPPPLSGKERREKGKKENSHSRKRHEVTTTTFGEYWCQPTGRRNSSRLPASQETPPSPTYDVMHRDPSRPCNFFALRPRILLTFRTGEGCRSNIGAGGSNEIRLISMFNFR